MGREAETVHTFDHDPKFRLSKEVTVVRCDDGTVYEFEKAKDEPESLAPRLVRGVLPDGEVVNQGTRKALPAAVEDTVETLLGGWSK